MPHYPLLAGLDYRQPDAPNTISCIDWGVRGTRRRVHGLEPLHPEAEALRRTDVRAAHRGESRERREALPSRGTFSKVWPPFIKFVSSSAAMVRSAVAQQCSSDYLPMVRARGLPGAA